MATGIVLGDGAAEAAMRLRESFNALSDGVDAVGG